MYLGSACWRTSCWLRPRRCWGMANLRNRSARWQPALGPLDLASQILQQQPLVLCFLIIATGMGLGSIRIVGLSLGTSGVLFAALLFGHLGQHEAWAMPEMVGKLGLVLFVYAVGLGAGPTLLPHVSRPR